MYLDQFDSSCLLLTSSPTPPTTTPSQLHLSPSHIFQPHKVHLVLPVQSVHGVGPSTDAGITPQGSHLQRQWTLLLPDINYKSSPWHKALWLPFPAMLGGMSLELLYVLCMLLQLLSVHTCSCPNVSRNHSFAAALHYLWLLQSPLSGWSWPLKRGCDIEMCHLGLALQDLFIRSLLTCQSLSSVY